jgi:hypothetical protein
MRPRQTSTSFTIRSFRLVLILCGLSSTITFGQTCQTAATIPAEQKKLGGGTATVHYDGVTKVKGGQGIYVKVKNENILGVSYILTIVEDTIPEGPNCTYKALLPPHRSVILSGSLFAEPPIGWKVTVAVGEESDAGVLTYEIYSNPKADKASKLGRQKSGLQFYCRGKDPNESYVELSATQAAL